MPSSASSNYKYHRKHGGTSSCNCLPRFLCLQFDPSNDKMLPRWPRCCQDGEDGAKMVKMEPTALAPGKTALKPHCLFDLVERQPTPHGGMLQALAPTGQGQAGRTRRREDTRTKVPQPARRRSSGWKSASQGGVSAKRGGVLQVPSLRPASPSVQDSFQKSARQE